MVDKQARKSETTDLIYVPSPASDVEKAFRRIYGGLAWGDPLADDKAESDHAVVIAGEDEAHKIIVFRQLVGKFVDLSTGLIVLKDNLLVSNYLVPPEPEGMKRALYDLDGLTRYKSRGRDRFKQLVYEVADPQAKWPSFRSRDCKAIVQDYADPFLIDFEPCRLKVYDLVAAGDVELVYTMLGPLEKIIGQSPSNTVKSPIFRAYIGVVWTLWMTSEKRRRPQKQEQPEWPWKDFER